VAERVLRGATPDDADAVARLWQAVGEHLRASAPDVFRLPSEAGCRGDRSLPACRLPT
jgi:hypothetical protein